MAWVGSEVLPHEADLRRWLRRWLNNNELEDVIQESYCRISELTSVEHIRSGRAYLFATARSVFLMRVRRERVVRMEMLTEIDTQSIVDEKPDADRIVSGQQELARVASLIDGLPERCRQVFRMRKVEGLSQRQVATSLGLAEHTIENEVRKGLRLILAAISESEKAADRKSKELSRDGKAEYLASDR